MSAAPLSYLLNAIFALIDLVHTRRRVRLHPHPVYGPAAVAGVRKDVLSKLADAAAFGALPIDKTAIRQWATWIEAGADDRADDIALASKLSSSVHGLVLQKVHEAMLLRLSCAGCCPCDIAECGHGCQEHELGGGRCTVQGCRCTGHYQRTKLAQIAHEAHELARAAEARTATPVNEPAPELAADEDDDEPAPVSAAPASGENPPRSERRARPELHGGA